jgi:Skp family chaperone for outer membrane proteins
MYLISTVTAIIFFSLTSLGLTYWFGKKISYKQQKIREESVSEIKVLEEEIESKINFLDPQLSKSILATLLAQRDQHETNLNDQRNNFKGIEEKLDKAQKAIEQKEAKHQEVKTASLEDDLKLAQLQTECESILAEMSDMERSIANKMKQLDDMLSEVELTKGQRDYLTTLSDALSQAGESIRTFTLEYQGVKERILEMQQNLTDLEMEYIRLVETNLGL